MLVGPTIWYKTLAPDIGVVKVTVSRHHPLPTFVAAALPPEILFTPVVKSQVPNTPATLKLIEIKLRSAAFA